MTEAEKFIREYFKTDSNSEALGAFFRSAGEVLEEKNSVDEGKKEIIAAMLLELIHFSDYSEQIDVEDYNSYELTDEDKQNFCEDYAQKIIENPKLELSEIQKNASSYAEECFREWKEIEGEALGQAF